MKNITDKSSYYELFEYFSENHNLILVESEIVDIIEACRKYIPEKALTVKMIEARKFVDEYIDNKKFSPTYGCVSEGLGIKETAAYSRLRGYRHKMVTKK